VSKDDITAGDGAKHDVIADKGRLATATTCNVFRLLKACGLPVAFELQDSPTSFVAPKCEMLPYEVVVRREAHGSYLKRNPHFAKGQLFPQLVVELFLKTKDRSWNGKPLICDDPLMLHAKGDARISLFNPAKPIHGQEPFLVLADTEVFSHADEPELFPEMERIVRHTFLVLEKAWQLEGGTLVDLKVEFGFDTKGNLLLADVIETIPGEWWKAAPISTSRSIAMAARSMTWSRNTAGSPRSPAASRCRANGSSCGAARPPTRPSVSPKRSAISPI
jgi:phosphoribosylaminoimidazole-succinocarboxamide synthase